RDWSSDVCSSDLGSESCRKIYRTPRGFCCVSARKTRGACRSICRERPCSLLQFALRDRSQPSRGRAASICARGRACEARRDEEARADRGYSQETRFTGLKRRGRVGRRGKKNSKI